MQKELAVLTRYLGALGAFAARYPVEAAFGFRAQPYLYATDPAPVVNILISPGWSGMEPAESALAQAGAMFGPEGWVRKIHPGGTDIHWRREIAGVLVQLLYVETGAKLDGTPVRPDLFPVLPKPEPPSPAAADPATTAGNHGPEQDCQCTFEPCADGMGHACTKCGFHVPF